MYPSSRYVKKATKSWMKYNFWMAVSIVYKKASATPTSTYCKLEFRLLVLKLKILNFEFELHPIWNLMTFTWNSTTFTWSKMTFTFVTKPNLALHNLTSKWSYGRGLAGKWSYVKGLIAQGNEPISSFLILLVLLTRKHLMKTIK